MVLVLAMNRDQVAPQLPQLSWVGSPTVDAGRASLPELTLENQRSPPGLEQALDGRPISAVPHLVDTAARAQRQTQGVDDERLATARLSREQVEARAKPHTRVGDQGEGADPELLQHSCFGPRGRPQPSFSPSLR